MLPSNAIAEAIRAQKSVAAVARMTGIPKRTVQSVKDGTVPSVDNAQKICDAVGLEFYVGPPRTTAAPTVRELFEYNELPSELELAPDDMTTVSDPALAIMIAVLADAWEAGTEMERGHLLGRFDLAFRAERERKRPTGRVLEWLGWRVLDGGRRDTGGDSKTAGQIGN